MKREYEFTADLWLPKPRAEVFAFFGDAHNLQVLTPKWLDFKILTPAPIPMAAGTLIDYRIRLHGLPIRWRTEIAVWEPPHQFVDRQISGPYHLWHHTHSFIEMEGGTLCRDHVRYSPKGGAGLHWLFVRREVERIFAYRKDRLVERFWAPTPA